MNCGKLTDDQIIYNLNNICYCSFCTSSLNQPYCIPMYFRYVYINRKFTFYLTSLSNPCGIKLTNLNNNNKVSILFIRKDFGNIYSIVVQGTAEIQCNKEITYIIVKALEITGRNHVN